MFPVFLPLDALSAFLLPASALLASLPLDVALSVFALPVFLLLVFLLLTFVLLTFVLLVSVLVFLLFFV